MTGRRNSMLALAVVLSLELPAGALAAPAARVEPVKPCFVAPPKELDVGTTYDCGYVVVPEDASKPDGRTVKLGFLRLKARSDRPAAPLFMLAGGPGSTLISPQTFALLSPCFRAGRFRWSARG